MKNFFLVLVALTLMNCSAIDNLTKFDIDYNSSVTVKSSTTINLPFVVNTPPVQTNSESEFDSNNTRKDLIEEIYLKRMRLTISNPSGSDFSFLESIEVFIKADGVEEISIAVLNPVAANAGGTIELEASNADLKEYIKKDNFTLRVSTVTDEVLDNDTTIDILSTFAVDAKILGI